MFRTYQKQGCYFQLPGATTAPPNFRFLGLGMFLSLYLLFFLDAKMMLFVV